MGFGFAHTTYWPSWTAESHCTEVCCACGQTLPIVAAGSTEVAIGLHHRLTQNTSTEADWHACACAHNMLKGKGRVQAQGKSLSDWWTLAAVAL